MDKYLQVRTKREQSHGILNNIGCPGRGDLDKESSDGYEKMRLHSTSYLLSFEFRVLRDPRVLRRSYKRYSVKPVSVSVMTAWLPFSPETLSRKPACDRQAADTKMEPCFSLHLPPTTSQLNSPLLK